MNTTKHHQLQPLSLHSPLNSGLNSGISVMGGRYSPSYHRPDTMRRLSNSGNLFGGIDESMLARVEALAAVDIGKNQQMMKHDGLYAPTHHEMTAHSPNNRVQMPLHGFGAPTHDTMLDQISVAASVPLSSMNDPRDMVTSHGPMYSPVYSHSNTMGQAHIPPHNMHHTMHELECDPRELEAFAERFKQRRIKLGVTQADVGRALGNLKLPGVGSLSQSTICRFESLTLSHNNMIALKPVLQAWLEDAERAARERKEAQDMYTNGDKKRKRTSIAAPEKRSLEAYFAVQPRPSGEKIAQIAEKLDLKKNVVRVWFCNQRQKQKRMKFSAVNH